MKKKKITPYFAFGGSLGTLSSFMDMFDTGEGIVNPDQVQTQSTDSEGNVGSPSVSGEATPNNTDKQIDISGMKNITEQNPIPKKTTGLKTNSVGAIADTISSLDTFTNPSVSQQKNGGGMSGQQTGGAIGQGLGTTIGSIFGMGELGGSVGKMVGGGIGGIIDPEAGTTRFEQTGTKPHYGMGGEFSALEGDNHNSPSGGIDMNGGKTEGGESKVKTSGTTDLIFSDRLSPDGKHTFSDLAKKINNKYKGREKDRLATESKMKELTALGDLQKEVNHVLNTQIGNIFGAGGILDSLVNNTGNLAYLLGEGKHYDKVDYGTIKPEHIQDNVSDQVISSTFNNARESLRNSGNMSGSRLRANLAGLANTEATSRAKVKTDIATANVGMDNQFGMFNQQTKMKGMEDTAANKGQALTNFYAALNGLGQNTAGAMRDSKMDKTQAMTLDLLKVLYPDVDFGNYTKTS